MNVLLLSVFIIFQSANCELQCYNCKYVVRPENSDFKEESTSNLPSDESCMLGNNPPDRLIDSCLTEEQDLTPVCASSIAVLPNNVLIYRKECVGIKRKELSNRCYNFTLRGLQNEQGLEGLTEETTTIGAEVCLCTIDECSGNHLALRIATLQANTTSPSMNTTQNSTSGLGTHTSHNSTSGSDTKPNQRPSSVPNGNITQMQSNSSKTPAKKNTGHKLGLDSLLVILTSFMLKALGFIELT